jgi:broad-specificity NMP kinase
VIVWVNGTFGAGKTTVSKLVSARIPRMRLFDPEYVGYLLRASLTDHPVRDFRDWESWRVLTPVVADELVRFTGQSLVAPQTVLEEDYWDELVRALTDRGHDVLHVLLEADEATMRARVEADVEEAMARAWRLDHLARYAEARAWMVRRADLVVDTTDLTAEQVADRVAEAAGSRANL